MSRLRQDSDRSGEDLSMRPFGVDHGLAVNVNTEPRIQTGNCSCNGHLCSGSLPRKRIKSSVPDDVWSAAVNNNLRLVSAYTHGQAVPRDGSSPLRPDTHRAR